MKTPWVHWDNTSCAFFWITWSISHGILLEANPHGGGYLTLLLCTSWIGDGAAYYVGKTLGKTQFSKISPNKTWEGAIAEVVFTLTLSLAFKFTQATGSFTWLNLPPVHTVHYVVIGLFVSMLGILGDIFESFVKRIGKAKDSGIFFPGHGGVLDRFDGFFFFCPAIYYYVYFVVDNKNLSYF